MTAQSTMTDTREGRSGPEDVKRLGRSSSNRVFAGVCGGIAEYYGSDPRAVRLLAIFIGVFTGIFPMLFVYLIAAVMLPEEGTAGSSTAVAGPSQMALVLGGLLIVIGAVGIATVWLHVDWDVIWPAALIALGALTVTFALHDRNRVA